MNNDLISRSALLAELNDDKYTWEDYDTVEFAVQNLPAVDAGPKWISVKGRKPESGSRCLVVRYDAVTKTYFEDILWFDKGNWWNRRYQGDYAVTHWMPLPDLPKEG